MARSLAETVAADVAKVRQAATAILELKGESLELQVLPDNSRLLASGQGLIAVIGPTPDFKEAVLAEIGVGHTRPYGRMEHLPITDGFHKAVAGRKTRFQLSEKQYAILASSLLDLMRGLTFLRMRQWKHAGWDSNIRHLRWCKKQKEMSLFKKATIVPRGINFNIPIAFKALVSDLLQIERRSWRRYYSRLAKLIALILNRYQNRRRIDFEALEEVTTLRRMIASRSFLAPEYRRREIFEFFKEKGLFIDDVAEHILGLRCVAGKLIGEPAEVALLEAKVWDNIGRVPSDLSCWKTTSGDRSPDGYVSFTLTCPSLVADKTKALQEHEAEYRLRHDPLMEEYVEWCKEQYEEKKERLRQSGQRLRLALLVRRFEGGNIQRRPRNSQGRVFIVVSGKIFVKKSS